MDRETPIFSTSYFPSIEQFGAMAQEGSFLIEAFETFPKQTNRNRTVILTANGVMTLSVPVIRPQGTHTKTKDIGISYSERWNIIHWRTIEAAYNSSPFFLYYRDDIEKLLMKRYSWLLDLNEELLDYLAKRTKIELSVNYTKQYERTEELKKDYRNRYSYKHPDTGKKTPEYTQVFSDRQKFESNIGILDTLFNLGPETKDYLLKLEL